MAVNTYTSNAQRTNTIASAEALARKEQQLTLVELLDQVPMDMHRANNMKLRRSLPPTVTVDANGVPVPLVEGQYDTAGVNPAFDLLTHEDITVTMKLYAKSYLITDILTDLSEDNVRQDATTNIGEWAGYMEELVAYHAMLATTNKYYANGAAMSAVNTAITETLLSKVERSMLAEKAIHFQSFTTGATKYATTPVPATFVLMGHTDCKHDLKLLANWKPVESYGSQKVISTYEVGTIGAFRVILTPNFPSVADGGGTAGTMKSTSGTSADVYRMIAFGKRAGAVSSPKGKKGLKTLIVQPDTPSAVDPAGRNGFVTGKEYFASAITNNAWCCEIDVAVTAL